MRSIDSNFSLSGFEAASRARLARVLRATHGTVTPESAAAALADTRLAASKQLARWAEQGWLQRVRRGIYVPVLLESERAEAAPEDAWLIANTAFAPCFIAGWSAVEHWTLTEQVFRSLCVATSRRPRHREQTIGGTVFVLHSVPEAHLFGLKAAWRGAARVQASDPSRTMVDLLTTPAWGGGIRMVVDVLQACLKSEHRNLPLLVDYAARLGNGAVFKRMGYLLQQHAPEATEVMAACAGRLTAGCTKLDPALPSARLVTAWGLWLPTGW